MNCIVGNMIRKPTNRNRSAASVVRRPQVERRTSRRFDNKRKSADSSSWLILVGSVILLLILGLAAVIVFRSLFAVISPPLTSPQLPSMTLTPTIVPAKPTPTPLLKQPQDVALEVSITFDQSDLQQFMLDLINADRTGAGLSIVAWDDTAAYAGQLHAEEMATYGYLSHWNLEGNGPDYRYTSAGGLHAVQENVYSWYHRYVDGSAVPVSDWKAVTREAQIALMDSPGHRSNILNPSHTHVGIGMAYNETNGEFRIAQEFVGHYVQLDPLPRHTSLGAQLRISGQVLLPTDELLLNLAYETFPTPMSIQALNATTTFQSPASPFTALALEISTDERFSELLVLDYEQGPGRYHVILWMQTVHGSIPAADFVMDVRLS